MLSASAVGPLKLALLALPSPSEKLGLPVPNLRATAQAAVLPLDRSTCTMSWRPDSETHSVLASAESASPSGWISSLSNPVST